MSRQLGAPDFFAANPAAEHADTVRPRSTRATRTNGRGTHRQQRTRDADLSRESRGRVSNEASSAGRRTADVPDGSGAAIRRMLLAEESHTKGGISTMAKKAAKGGKKKGGKKR